MKRNLALIAGVLCLGILTACNTPMAPALTRTFVSNAATVALIKDPGAAPVLQAGEMVLCNMAGATDLSPSALQANLAISIHELNSPLGKAVLNDILALYQAAWDYYGPQVTSSDMQPYLDASCKGLQDAVPLSTPKLGAARKTVAPPPYLK